MKTMTKTSTIPPLRVNDDVRIAAEAALMAGETLSAFVLEAIQFNIQRRSLQQEFVARGLAARDDARRTGKYVSADEMLARLDKTLAQSRKVTARK
jgi:predicted transcriptional regulator